MTKRWPTLMLAALIAGGTLACDESATGPGAGEGSTDLDVAADMELQVVGDSDLAVLLVDGMALHTNQQADGAPFGAGRECFREARRLLRDGDTEAARAQARECRRMMVQIALETHGEQAIDELFARVETLVERISEADDEFARLGELGDRLQALLDEAYALRDAGDLVGAGERLVLALQMADRMRHRHRDFVRDPQVHVRLAIARGAESLRLADRLIDVPTPTQEVVLFRATEHQRRAEFALDQGWYRRAIVQARHAEQLSLYAVLNGERPTGEEALRLLALAEEMILAAEQAIGPDPTDAQRALLNRAIRLKEKGAQAIDAWQWRGVSLLWHSAVTSAVLIPDDGV
jgi:HEPN domain-containing protein